ncbi:DUF6252 family protein [Flaviaesturariibacter aridisoli]|uniref:Lipoprotein n=1 Tax=Flaviaesturariibacter aridisoli TaxID=2545761 RepID=A0A4R4DZK3_9BACT|nr:DUF6252 family protein [Flaviaesturariibacter aridisoli]TCZ72169.1 hypothetical protein E0486_08745 [Flaviaesturariibacter aridisoli]
MKNLIVLSAAVLALASCSKKVTELPEATDSGSNTFGARVNGELWAPQGKGILPHAPLLEASFAGNDNYVINARNISKSPTETEFEIYLQGVTRPGTYALNQTTELRPAHTASYAYFVERTLTPTHQWMTNAQTTGTVVITKVDKNAHVLAGTFSFRATDRNGGEVLDVTEGRFDLTIQ